MMQRGLDADQRPCFFSGRNIRRVFPVVAAHGGRHSCRSDVTSGVRGLHLLQHGHDRRRHVPQHVHLFPAHVA